MILRLVLFGLMAFGLLGFGVVAWVYTHPTGAGSSAQPAQIAMITMAHAVRAGNLLKSEDLASKDLSPARNARRARCTTARKRGATWSAAWCATACRSATCCAPRT